MSISFYLMAEKNFDGSLSVREFYEFKSIDTVRTDSGERPRVFITDRVDEDIKKEHADEYAAFTKWVADNETKAYQLARENLGVKVFVQDLAEPKKGGKK